ncbi:MAG: hypothetical protein R3F43_31640 [bacterium]
MAERTPVLAAAGFETDQEPHRGVGHGTFVPLLLAYPAADIPTVQLSLMRGAWIRRSTSPWGGRWRRCATGVFIVASGNGCNMRGFMDPDPRHVDASRRFDDWLAEAVAGDETSRDRALTGWAAASLGPGQPPAGGAPHPLMVAAGAAGADRGAVAWSGKMMGKALSTHFGVGAEGRSIPAVAWRCRRGVGAARSLERTGHEAQVGLKVHVELLAAEPATLVVPEAGHPVGGVAIAQVRQADADVPRRAAHDEDGRPLRAAGPTSS